MSECWPRHSFHRLKPSKKAGNLSQLSYAAHFRGVGVYFPIYLDDFSRDLFMISDTFCLFVAFVAFFITIVTFRCPAAELYEPYNTAGAWVVSTLHPKCELC